MKKILLINFAIIMCLFVLCGCDEKKNNNSNNNVQANTPQKGNGPFELKEGNLSDDELTTQIKLSNVSFETGNNSTVFKADITNVSEINIEIRGIDIIVKNSSGKEIAIIKTIVDNLDANQTKTVEATIDVDLKDYATYEYVIQK